jgi:integral membrane sensor domain MASE1
MKKTVLLAIISAALMGVIGFLLSALIMLLIDGSAANDSLYWLLSLAAGIIVFLGFLYFYLVVILKIGKREKN